MFCFILCMKIGNYIQPLQFKSSNRAVYRDTVTVDKNSDNSSKVKTVRRVLYSNYTFFFRDDLERFNMGWFDFREFLAKTFKDTPKVNVYDFASSDGSEAYSLIISLIEELGEEEAKKFFPIKAYDIDKDIIQEAKSGKINGAEGDRESISCNTKGCIDKYFTVTKGDNPMYKCCYFYPKSNIKNLVEFEQADIADKIVDINPKDSIVLCRNFWPYLDEQKSSILFDKLCKKLDKSSLLVLGSFDLSNCFSMRDILKANNYVEVYKNTFKKAS